jgi:hypothetical protein
MLTEANYNRPYLAALEPSVGLSSLLVPAWHRLLHCTAQPSLFKVGHDMTSAVHACVTEMHDHLSVVCKAFSFALSGDSAAACTFRFPLHKQQSVCKESLTINFGLH